MLGLSLKNWLWVAIFTLVNTILMYLGVTTSDVFAPSIWLVVAVAVTFLIMKFTVARWLVVNRDYTPRLPLRLWLSILVFTIIFTILSHTLWIGFGVISAETVSMWIIAAQAALCGCAVWFLTKWIVTEYERTVAHLKDRKQDKPMSR